MTFDLGQRLDSRSELQSLRYPARSTVGFWSAQSGSLLDTPHRNSIRTLAVSDDGEWLVTGDYRGLCILWETRTRKVVESKRITEAGVSAIVFNERTREFLASSYDGNVYPIAALN